ncbi:MAG: OmpH family outer membrane protein [Bacteroidales bacterium]|nr:OmpH family outer membrane protein [Bacteroidales bacterium]
MKLFPRILLIVVMMASASAMTSAQSSKIGHINTSKLLQIMPGRDTAQTALENYARSLQNDLKTYQQEFEKKYQKYMQEEANMPKLMKETRQEELMQMEERIRKYQENAQQDLKEKEQELLQPILKKAQDAIDKVAKENGFTYILDTSQGSVVFVGEKGKDIMPLVRKELGIEDVPLPEEGESNQLQPVQQPSQNINNNIEMPDQEK